MRVLVLVKPAVEASELGFQDDMTIRRDGASVSITLADAHAISIARRMKREGSAEYDALSLYPGYPRQGTPTSYLPTYKEAGAGAPAPTYQPPRKWGMIFHVRWISDEIQSYISYAALRHISYLSNLRLDKYFIAIAPMIFSPAGTQV